MLKVELISLKTAKLAKEFGFQNGSRTIFTEYHKRFIYDGDKNHHESHKKGEVREDYDFFVVNNEKKYDYSNKNYTLYERPAQSVLHRWLRETQKLDIEINSGKYVETLGKYSFTIEGGSYSPYFDTYEEALENGLIEILNLI